MGIDTCDHTRAVNYFAESLDENCFRSTLCEKFNPDLGVDGKILKTCCLPGPKMGGEPGNKGTALNSGVFYLETQKSSPFCISDSKTWCKKDFNEHNWNWIY